jgi:hypothetical protein
MFNTTRPQIGTLNNVPCNILRITLSQEVATDDIPPDYKLMSWYGEAEFMDFESMSKAMQDWYTKTGTIETNKLKGNIWITEYFPKLFRVNFQGSGKPIFKE